jgi:Fe2+ or Zn2+ uptake regulation protein
MRDYQLLRILRTLGWENQVNEGWLSAALIAKKLCQFNYTANSNTVAGVMKRWTARGIVESKKLPVSGTVYRIKKEHRNKPLGHIVCQFNQRPVQKTFPKV